MSIRYKIYLIAIISIFLSGILIATVVYSSHRITDEEQEYRFSYQLNTAVSNLDTVTYEYLIHHENRIKKQWYTLYANILRELNNFRAESEKEEKDKATGLKDNFKQLKRLFGNVTANLQQGQFLSQGLEQTNDGNNAQLSLKREVTQLLTVSNKITKKTKELADSAYSEAKSIQELSNRVITIVAFLSALIITIICLFMAKSISRPMASLLEGIQKIGKGDLDHTIPVSSGDELGRLAHAFNQMAESLSKVTASRDDLRHIRSELEHEKAVTEYIMESLPGVFYLFDDQGQMYRWNRNLEKVIEYSSEEIAQMSPLDMFAQEDQNHIQEAIQEVFQTGRGEVEASYYTKNGRSIPYAFTGVRVNIEEKLYLIGVGIDISDRKKVEAELEAANQELRRSNQELEQFAYVASHDLQEPLRMVSSYTQLLEKRYSDKLDESAKTFIHYAVDGATRMQSLINDLLTYSRITTKGTEFKKVQTEQIFANVLSNLKNAIDDAQAEITHDELPCVQGDFSQLTRVFQNLVSNSLKYRKEDTTPCIHVAAEEQSTEWVFSVQDNSIGIEQQYEKRIFEIFKRLHTSREYPGTGMGLSLCKRIVERHGGKMWVESESGVGSTFFFSLPKCQEAP